MSVGGINGGFSSFQMTSISFAKSVMQTGKALLDSPAIKGFADSFQPGTKARGTDGAPGLNKGAEQLENLKGLLDSLKQLVESLQKLLGNKGADQAGTEGGGAGGGAGGADAAGGGGGAEGAGGAEDAAGAGGAGGAEDAAGAGGAEGADAAKGPEDMINQIVQKLLEVLQKVLQMVSQMLQKQGGAAGTTPEQGTSPVQSA